jgi:hypothetical protein
MPKKTPAVVDPAMELSRSTRRSCSFVLDDPDDEEGSSDSDESSFGHPTKAVAKTSKAIATIKKAAAVPKPPMLTPTTTGNNNSKSRTKEKGDPLSTTHAAATATATTPLTNETTGTDEFTVVLPFSWMATGNPPPGECNLLIQVDPEDATRLDYEGVSGAIGRFEAGDNGILIDLKGRQYHGSLLPGPTALLVSLAKGLRQLRVEGVTDEFATVVQTSDVMAKLDAIVTGAELDAGYQYVEENVNRVDRSKQPPPMEGAAGSTTTDKGTKKRAAGTSKPAAKRRKKSSTT